MKEMAYHNVSVYLENTFLWYLLPTDKKLLSSDERRELLESIWNKYYALIFNVASEEDEEFENKCFNNFLNKVRIEICKSQALLN